MNSASIKTIINFCIFINVLLTVSKYVLFVGICLSGYESGICRARIFLFDGEIIADAHCYNKNSITGIIAPSNFLQHF